MKYFARLFMSAFLQWCSITICICRAHTFLENAAGDCTVYNKKFTVISKFLSIQFFFFITENANLAFFPTWTQQIWTRSKILLLFYMGLKQQRKHFVAFIYIYFFRSRRGNLYRPSLTDEYFTWIEVPVHIWPQSFDGERKEA